MITIAELADILSVAERTIYQWANSGEVPAYKVGNSWRFKQDEIETWLNTRRNSSSVPAQSSGCESDADQEFHVRVQRCAERVVGFLTASEEKEWIIEHLAEKMGEDILLVKAAVKQAVAYGRCEVSDFFAVGKQRSMVKLKKGE